MHPPARTATIGSPHQQEGPMTATALTFSAYSPAEMEKGYLEYRRACYHLLLQDAREQELLDVLAKPRTHDEVLADWSDGGEPATVQRLLKALVTYGALTQEGNGRAATYLVNPDHAESAFDRDLMARAVGAEQADALLHAKSYGTLVKVARNGNNVVQAEFSAANKKVWDEFLTLPFYEYFRKAAVEVITQTCREGGLLLDAACGLGYGIQELNQALTVGAQIVGADISHDFVELAIGRTREAGNVILARLDLQTGLPALASGAYDGIMIIGAWHFLTRPDDVLAQFARLLRPGGVAAIGYYYTTLETFDHAVMDLRLSLREPVARPTDPEKLAVAAKKLGLVRHSAFTIGSFGFSAFRRPE